MQAILDRITKTSQTAKAKGTAAMDELRRMAEAVNSEIRNEELIDSVGAAADASAESRYFDAATSPDSAPMSQPSAAKASLAARPNASPYATQMQAYRENA